MRHAITVFLTLGFWLAALTPVIADQLPSDRSADANRYFIQVRQANGVLLRVQTDEAGQELTDSATVKLYSGQEVVDDQKDIEQIWQQAAPIDESLQQDAEQIADSSTWGFWGWHNRRGWAPAYYYYSYRPYFNYYGAFYPTVYSTPYYYTRYYAPYYYNAPGYRYYYYYW